MRHDVRFASPAPLPVTRRVRASGVQQIAQIQIHATRGRVAHDRQVHATEAWFASPQNDRGGWGGSADFVIGPDHRLAGEIAIVQFGDWRPT